MCLEVNLRLEEKLMMEYKQLFPISKMSFKITLKIIYWVKEKGKIIMVACCWTEVIYHYEPYEKTLKNEENIRKHDIYY